MTTTGQILTGESDGNGHGDGSVRIWDVATGEVVRALPGRHRALTEVAWSSDGTRILTGTGDANDCARIWDVATGQLVRALTAHDRKVSAVAWSPDGTRILTGDGESGTHIWDAATGEESGPVFAHFTDGEVAVYHPTTNIVIGCTDGAWRWLGWNIRDDSVDRLPAETFGELPPIDPRR